MSFGQAVSTVFSKYATFSGRAHGSEYWWWYLFVTIVFVVAGVIDRAAGLDVRRHDLRRRPDREHRRPGPPPAEPRRRRSPAARHSPLGVVAARRARADHRHRHPALLLRHRQRVRQRVRPLPQGLSVQDGAPGSPGQPGHLRRHRGEVTPACWLPEEWLALEAAHEERIDAATAAHSRSVRRIHPTEDFLFRYYTTSARRGAGTLAPASCLRRPRTPRARWTHYRTGVGCA